MQHYFSYIVAVTETLSHGITPQFSVGVLAVRSLVFCVVFCRSLFVSLSFFLPVVLSWLCEFCLCPSSFASCIVLTLRTRSCRRCPSFASCIVLALRILSLSFFFRQLYCLDSTDSVLSSLSFFCQLYCLGFTDSVFVLLLLPVVLSWLYGFCLFPSSFASCIVLVLRILSLFFFFRQLYSLDFTDYVFVLLLSPVLLSWVYGFCLWPSFASGIVLALRILSLSFFFRQLHCLGFADSVFVLLLPSCIILTLRILSWSFFFCQLHCLGFTDSIFVLLLLPVVLSWLYGF